MFAVYGGMIAVAVMAFLAIRASGDQLTAPAGAGLSQAPGGSINSTLFQALLALGVIIGTARVMGGLFGLIGQPAVIGELVGGIMLGPSFLGQIAPALHDQLLPTGVTAFLGVYSQLGVILLLVSRRPRAGSERAAKEQSCHAGDFARSIIVPFLLGGAGLALSLYPKVSNSGVPFTVFALFLACRSLGHGVSGARANPDRSENQPQPDGGGRAHLRRDR